MSAGGTGTFGGGVPSGESCNHGAPRGVTASIAWIRPKEVLERGRARGAAPPYGLGSASGAGWVFGLGPPTGFFLQSGSGVPLAGPSKSKAAVISLEHLSRCPKGS